MTHIIRATATAPLWASMALALCCSASCVEEKFVEPPAPIEDGLTDPEFVALEAASFLMGSEEGAPFAKSEETAHQVQLTRAFEIQSTEVTQGQWFRLMDGVRPAFFSECGEDCPVERVNWYEALEYLNRLSTSRGLPACYQMLGCSGFLGDACRQEECQDTQGCERSSCLEGFTCTDVIFAGLDCQGYRLPTEAEWEYAAKGGTTTSFYNGDLEQRGGCNISTEAVEAIGWFCVNASSQTQPCALKEPTRDGLYDVAGNVWEWVWDLYKEDLGAEDAVDPLGPEGPHVNRVIKGGAWSSEPVDSRPAARLSDNPNRRSHTRGFRAARTLP